MTFLNKLKTILFVTVIATSFFFTTRFWQYVFPEDIEVVYYLCADFDAREKSVICDRVKNAWVVGQENFTLVKDE